MLVSTTFHIATNQDIALVLNLQQKYLSANLTDKEKEAGFVTTPFTVSQLEDVIAQQGLFLAKQNQQLIAYCFGASWQYFSQWPIFVHMISFFDELQYQDSNITVHNSFQYGPICIDIPFRGTGLVKTLFEFMRQNMQHRYPISVTFINKINIPSFKAHTQKLNWQVLREFSFNNNTYYVLAYNMKDLVI
jgi:hypothetical protein